MDSPYATRDVRDLIGRALAEDLGGRGDLTVEALVPDEARLAARIVAKQDGVVCGLPLVALVCEAVGPGTVAVSRLAADGTRVRAGETVLEVEGRAATLLVAERTALNLCQRLSGIATRARAFADAVAGTGAEVFDTRKTTPGLRLLEKHAVAAGGCRNHRFGLFDQVLIKDNHVALMGAGGPAAAVRACRERLGGEAVVEVEIERVDDLEAVIAAGADIVLLDNLPPEELRRAVALRGDRPVRLEASGNVTLGNVRAVAETGVDRISVGALTHSVPALDLSMRCLEE